MLPCRERSNYKDVVVPDVWYPQLTSHSGHMGAYLNRQTALSHPTCDTHTLTHRNAHAHTQRTPTFALAQGDTPSPFDNHHSLCRLHTHTHTSRLFGYTSPACTHTHTPPHMHTQTHTYTLHRGPLALLPLHLAGAICFTRFVSG